MTASSETTQHPLDRLLSAVDEVCGSWSWWPETEFATVNAVITSSSVIALDDAYSAYVEWEQAQKGQAVTGTSTSTNTSTNTSTASSRTGWDCYFLQVAEVVASRSTCRSQRVGSVVVIDRSIISTGHNGPPRGVPHCDPCPRFDAGYPSGEGLHLCPASHAEVNALVQAARNGVSVRGGSLYLSSEGVQPCKSCAGAIVNAGIREVVGEGLRPYDELTAWILAKGGVVLRPPYMSDPPLGGFTLGCK